MRIETDGFQVTPKLDLEVFFVSSYRWQLMTIVLVSAVEHFPFKNISSGYFHPLWHISPLIPSYFKNQSSLEHASSKYFTDNILWRTFSLPDPDHQLLCINSIHPILSSRLLVLDVCVQLYDVQRFYTGDQHFDTRKLLQCLTVCLYRFYSVYKCSSLLR